MGGITKKHKHNMCQYINLRQLSTLKHAKICAAIQYSQAILSSKAQTPKIDVRS